MKIAIYARVSTEEQTTSNQCASLEKYAAALGSEVIEVYEDVVSGGDANRPAFRRMMGDAARHKFDVVLIWALDRFSREGILNTLNYLKKLRSHNVSLKSLQESWLDTRDEGMGELIIAIFAWAAKMERTKISDRTKAGLKGAVNVGKRGRDKKPRKKGGYYLRHSPHLKTGGFDG